MNRREFFGWIGSGAAAATVASNIPPVTAKSALDMPGYQFLNRKAAEHQGETFYRAPDGWWKQENCPYQMRYFYHAHINAPVPEQESSERPS